MIKIYDGIHLCRVCHGTPRYLKPLNLWFCLTCKRFGRLSKIVKVSSDVIKLPNR